jgi:hypothetical protein
MPITIDKKSMTILPTADPLVVEISLDYTKDTLTVGQEYLAAWKSTTVLWNTNRPAGEFMTAVQDAIAKERSETTALKTLKDTIAAATGNIKTGMVRSDPTPAKPALGSDATNPLYVRVVS